MVSSQAIRAGKMERNSSVQLKGGAFKHNLVACCGPAALPAAAHATRPARLGPCVSHPLLPGVQAALRQP